jgi:DoxX-like protein
VKEKSMSWMPPLMLIQIAIAAVWLYEGLWCKILGREPNQVRVVQAVPFLGPGFATSFLKLLGAVECALGVWVLSGLWPVAAAVVQTGLLVAMNTNGLLFARHLIHDPPGMVVKNFVFVVLMWVAAGTV